MINFHKGGLMIWYILIINRMGENMDKKVIDFKFERATKNTYRFQEKSNRIACDRHFVRPEDCVRFQRAEESEGYGGVGLK
jgi:hypothetical protein